MIMDPSNSLDVIKTFYLTKKFNIKISDKALVTSKIKEILKINNTIHLDMGSMFHKEIDINQKTLTLGPGNIFSEI
jgi:hypothetical protein